MDELKVKKQKKISRPMLGFWHIIFSFHPAWDTQEYYVIEFGIFKLKRIPNVGEMYSKSDYKGFWWQWKFRLPTFIFTHNSKIGSDYKR